MPKTKSSAKPAATKFEDGQRISMDLEGTLTYANIVTIDKKKETADVKTDDGGLYVCEFDEMTVEEDDAGKEPADDEAPTGKAAKGSSDSGSKSLADRFNAIPKSEGGAMGLPKGNWEALIIDMDCAETEKGISAYFEIVGVSDAEVEGKTTRKYYQLFDAAGEAQEQGIGFFKQDLVNVGIDEDDIEVQGEDNEELIASIKKIMKKVVKTEPWITITVKEGKNNYMNTYINGLMENQKEKPANPND